MTEVKEYEMRKLSGEEILSIYNGAAREHFPEAELKPVEIIERMLAEDGYTGLGLFLEEKLIGYAFFVKVPSGDVLLLDYYAVQKEFRNGGTGSLFLQKMQEIYKDRAVILLETEEPEKAKNQAEYNIRVRRNGFYERNGAVRTCVKSRLYIVEFGIFVIPLREKYTDDQVYAQLDAIYHYMFGEEGYEKYVRIWKKDRET